MQTIKHELNEDTDEMMETDDNCNALTNCVTNANNNHFGANRVKVKRKLIDSNASFDLSNLIDNNIDDNDELMSRQILKAKRKLTQQIIITDNNKNNDNIKDGLTCVLDTNILLSNLNELKRLIVLHQNYLNNKAIVSSNKISSFIIPWIVIQELDYQKTINNNLSKRAITFINEQLRIKDGLIRGEKCMKDGSKTNGVISEELNDDKIINCCLKLLSINGSKKVILISNDINLCNKALINDITAVNWSEFHKKFCDINNKYKSERTANKSNQKFVSHCEQHLEQSAFKRHKKSITINCDKPMPQMYSLTPHISFSSTKEFEAKSTPDKPYEYTSMSSSLVSKIVPKPVKLSPKLSRHKTKSSPSHTKCNEEFVIKYKYKCEQKMIDFIREQYVLIWGENDWKKMLEINLDNATLRDMIRLIHKEWFSFSDYFNRKISVKSLIDKLHIRLNQENIININDAELYKDLKMLLSDIKSHKCSRKLSY